MSHILGGESSLLDAPKFLNATQLAEAQKKKRMLKYHEFLDLKAIPMNHGYNIELDFPEAELIRQLKAFEKNSPFLNVFFGGGEHFL